MNNINHITQKIIKQLRKALPSDQLLYEREDLKPYECDALSAYHAIPLAVALPDTIEQLKTILSICYENNTPVVARGAGTGLSGGALPIENGLLLSLAKLIFLLIMQVFPSLPCFLK